MNYPVRRVLIKMENDSIIDSIIDMADDITKFCVSVVTINATTVGIDRFISSWKSSFHVRFKLRKIDNY